jgi:putative tricarboxylic transport membrane protein
MGVFGLALGTLGLDPVTAVERFTFRSNALMEGLNIAAVAMGLFGIGEIFYLAESIEAREEKEMVKSPTRLLELLPNQKDWKMSMKPITRGTLLGFLLGIIPGGGALIASFASYATEKRFSRQPEKFGKGAIEGVAGPESANNAAVSGCFIPLLTLGIPSNVVMALLMAAFVLHGVTPGPFILKERPDLFWGVVTSMYIGNVILLILNVPLIKYFVKITQVPNALLSPLIILICIIGAYNLNNSFTDVWVMIVFGGLGYLMRKFGYEPAPLMLAFILGPILERTMRQSLLISQGSPFIFFLRPISVILMGMAFLIIISPIFGSLFHRTRFMDGLQKIRKIVRG